MRSGSAKLSNSSEMIIGSNYLQEENNSTEMISMSDF